MRSVWQSNYAVPSGPFFTQGRDSGSDYYFFFFLSLHSSLGGPCVVSAPHPRAITKQNFSFPLGFFVQLWLVVPCNAELLLQHPFTVERCCSLLHFDKFSFHPSTSFPQSVSQFLACWLRNAGWFSPCPRKASVYAFFGSVLIFVCSELKLQSKHSRLPCGDWEGREHNHRPDVMAFLHLAL